MSAEALAKEEASPPQFKASVRGVVRVFQNPSFDPCQSVRANRHSERALVRSQVEAAQGGGTGGVLEARLRATNAATFRLALILRTGLRKRSAPFLLSQKPLQGFLSQNCLAEALPLFPPAPHLNVDSLQAETLLQF